MTDKDIQIEFERVYTAARAKRLKQCAPRVCEYYQPYQDMFEAFQDGVKHGLKMAEETHANARLIAAAPELLETLEHIACADTATWDADMRDEFRWWAQTRAKLAIAKAKGG